MAEYLFKITAAKRFESKITGVFWDVDDCEIPVGLNAVSVSRNIRSALKRLNYRGDVSIFAYGDANKILDGLDSGDTNKNQGGLESGGITIVEQTSKTFDYRLGTSIYTGDDLELVVNHTPGDKDKRLQRILIDFMCWQVDNPAPANLMLVLGDFISRHTEFMFTLNHTFSLGYNIHYVYPQMAPGPHSGCPVHTKCLREKLSVGGTPLEEDEDKSKSSSRRGYTSTNTSC